MSYHVFFIAQNLAYSSLSHISLEAASEFPSDQFCLQFLVWACICMYSIEWAIYWWLGRCNFIHSSNWNDFLKPIVSNIVFQKFGRFKMDFYCSFFIMIVLKSWAIICTLPSFSTLFIYLRYTMRLILSPVEIIFMFHFYPKLSFMHTAHKNKIDFK